MILSTAEFLLPRKGAGMSKWAVIACDQFTSDRAYWDKLDAYVGDAPSTLRLILPEVYLGDGDGEKRAADIYAEWFAEGTGAAFKKSHENPDLPAWYKNPPQKESPAPVVSTALLLKPGTKSPFPSLET